MMDWFKPRRYRHFDAPVNRSYAEKIQNPEVVTQHSFSPLLYYTKNVKRYKPSEKRVVNKKRPIMYASHRDSCIYSYYSHLLALKLDAYYRINLLEDIVVAYRALGKSNYDFAAEALDFAISKSNCTILAFDISDFFSSLNHQLLKSRLKRILEVNELPEDWYKIFREITKYKYVSREELQDNTAIQPVLHSHKAESRLLCTIKELKEHRIPIYRNPKNSNGIPQGTPISATFSNLYLIDFDVKIRQICDERDAFYRRYSDDLLIICDPQDAKEIKFLVYQMIADEHLKINPDKTEENRFEVNQSSHRISLSQYLGFILAGDGPYIRPASLARQRRRISSSIKRTRRMAMSSTNKGKHDKIYTKKLWKRYSSKARVRNFSSYAKRAEAAFEQGHRIRRQRNRLERFFEKQVRDLLNGD